MTMQNDLNTKIRYQKSIKMADEIVKICDIEDDLYRAIATTEREEFIPKGFGMHAYKLNALPLVANQWISSPLTVAKMTQALSCKGADSVLEIGCGSGYQAVILSKIVRRVFTIERIERLLKESKERFKKMGIHHIHARFDDGQNGWREFAPFDRILFSASPIIIPEKIFNQLHIGGILVAPMEKDGKQIITRFTKLSDNNIQKEELEECFFVPVKEGREF
ncbi:MAG: protein-L-isoaspartate(D-aspartate) O-methyltransferase [Sulfurospirillaceae bacterium]|nr:protein-L-isoaspartate(D-aspartate) O-methyltransferase [Sulfurospirillaceae bacterium]